MTARDTWLRPLLCLSLFALVLGGLSCDGKKPSAQQELGSISLEIQVPASGPAAAKAVVARGRIQVSGEGMVTRDTLVNVSNNLLSARIDGITLGLRTVSIDLLDGAGASLWQSSTTVTVTAEVAATATLELERVNDAAPEADFAASAEIGTALTRFEFNAEVSDIHDGENDLQVRWDFDNDGEFETDWSAVKSTTHTFGQAGNYSVTLQVRDRSQQVGSRTRNVRVVELVAQTGDNAGADSIEARASSDLVTIDGGRSSGIDGGALVYNWLQLLDIPGAKEVSVVGTLSDNNTTSARRVSFEPRDGPGLYVFTLLVRDEETGLESGIDTLYVNVLSQLPTAQVATPGTVRLGESVALQGTASDDSGEPRVRWRGEGLETLSDTTVATPLFTPAAAQVYEFFFIAIDAEGQESEPLRVQIAVSQSDNSAPVADAGDDILVILGDGAITLDGSDSADPDGDSLTYDWVQLGGPLTVNLSGDEEVEPSFAPASVGVYRFSLEVNDGQLNSASSEVLVSVVQGSGESTDVTGAFSTSVGMEPSSLDQVGPGADVFLLVYAGGMEEVAFYDIVLQLEPFDAFESWQFLPTAEDRMTVGDLRVLATDFGLEPNEIGVRGFTTAENAFDGDAILGVFQLRTAAAFNAEVGASIRLTEVFLGTSVDDGDEFGATDLNLVSRVNGGFIAVENQVPVADAGRDRQGVIGQQVFFNGGGSFDPDGDEIAQYDWYQVSGPVDLELDSAGGPNASFTPPEAGIYIFGLVVRDPEGAVSEEDVVRVAVLERKVENQAPVAVVAQPPGATVGDLVRLNGTSSYDPDGEDSDLEFDWFVISGPVNVSLSDPKASEPTFVAEAAGVYVFSLIVSDASLSSDPLQVEVEVNEKKAAEEPVASVRAVGERQVGERILLDASGSVSPGGQTLLYQWNQVSGPVPNNVAGIATAKPRFTALFPGVYIFELQVAYDPLGGEEDGGGGGIFDIDISIDILDDLAGSLIDELTDEVRQRLVFSLPVEVEVTVGPAVDALTRQLAGANVDLLRLPQVEIDDVGPGGDIPLALIAEGLEDVEAYNILLRLTPPDAFDVDASSFESALEGFVSSALIEEAGGDPNLIAVSVISTVGAFSGNGPLGAFNLVAADDFDEGTPAQLIVAGLQIGSLADFDAGTFETFSDADIAFAVKINGGFGGGTVTNRPPVADAGEDQTVEVGNRVNLNGRNSSDPDGDSYSFRWSAPEGIDLQFPTSGIPFFEATEVGTFGIVLVVTDNSGAESEQDQVLITVVEASEDPNNPPIANAGEDRTAEVGERISFNGDTPSSDPDGDVIASCEWAWPETATLEQATSCRPIFSATEVGEYVLELVVTDRRGARSAPDQVVVTVIPSSNRPPVADAGEDQTVELGSRVNLNGRASFDPDEGDQYSFRWIAPTGIDLSFPTSGIPFFEATEIGTFGIVLIVTDNSGAESDPDQVVITVVEKVVQLPVADAGPDRKAEVGDEVVLNGSNSTNIDGSSSGLNYQWYQEDGPDEVNLVGAKTAFPNFVPALPGTYIFSLEVYNAAEDYSPLDEVVVEVALGEVEALVVDAGLDQQTNVGEPVLLAGSASGGLGTYYFYWFQANGPVDLSLSDVESPTLEVVLPEKGLYEFVLDVEDDSDRFAADTVLVLAVEPDVPEPNLPQLLFSSDVDGDWEIYVINADGSGVDRLTNNTAADIDPDVARDGRIAFTSFRDGHTDPQGSGIGEIYTMNADGSNPVNLTASHLIGGFVVADEQPSWSPDGSSITFTSIDLDSFGNIFSQIFRISAAGGAPVNISRALGFDSEPDWSPDNGLIAFTGNRESDGLTRLYVMAPDGSGQSQLIFDRAPVGQPDWHPQRTQLVFTGQGSADLDIFVSTDHTGTENIDGSELLMATSANNRGNQWRPVWSPDGRFVAYISDRDGGQDLYIYDVEAGSETRVTQLFGKVDWPAWRPLNPPEPNF